ncbi:MAG: hypothetical protein FIA97_20130 [Methylococcaceae bacterium]|nr:hypothetical protein [Methylococcaceae bacterium]
MSIDAATGVIGWTPAATVGGDFSFTVTADDGAAQASQSVNVTVCKAPEHWDSGMAMCMQ